jgi:hypothetical protein
MAGGGDILGIDVSHPELMLAHASSYSILSDLLVLVTLGDTNDQVVLLLVSPCPLVPASVPARCMYATYDESSDSAEGGDALAGAVVELNLYHVRLGLVQCERMATMRGFESNIRA